MRSLTFAFALFTIFAGLSCSAAGGSEEPGGGSPNPSDPSASGGEGSGGAPGTAGSGGTAGAAGGVGPGSGGANTGGDGTGGDGTGGDGTGGVTGVPGVRFVGRTAGTLGSGDPVRFDWSGAGMVFRFSGTGATVRMNDASGYFTVLIDGVEQPRLETTTGAQDYVVASGLADGEHTVELYRRSEALYGVTRVESVSPQGTLLAPPVTARRVEIIGDSITCGNCNEGASGGPFAADTENHYLTYGSIAARAVGAELHAVCESGIGMFCNYSGTGYPPLPGFYDRALKSESTGWNFSSWQPHVVVINLGVNDFAGEGCRGLATLGSSYEDAYVAFLAHLRNKYPSASILCALAPSVAINWIYPYSDARARVQSAVQRRNDAGDAKVRWVDISPASVVAGCTGHPNVATHEAMAAKLVVELEKETW